MERDFVQFDRDDLRIIVRFPDKPSLIVDRGNVELSFFSGGPGGQNVNKNMNGVRLVYRIPEAYISASGITRELIAKSIGQRQREQNLAEAFRSLAEKIRRYFYIKPKRHKTKIPRSQKAKRLESKRLRGEKKRSRKIGRLDL